jgi:Ca-activated chloride channel family protein
MFEFTYLWIFALLPLPLLVRYLLKAQKQQYTEIWLPLASGLEHDQSGHSGNRLTTFLPWIIWGLLLSTLAKPMWIGEPIRLQQSSRNMIVSIDLSGSMREIDMTLNDVMVDRLTLVKDLLTRFIKTRKGDRLGLILFADHAYLQTPLTFDLKTIAQMIDESQLGLVGTQTAIGESIALAIKRFVENKNEQRVFILLTDGANTAGVIKPLQAAKQAAKNNVTIYTIGIGADVMIRRSFFGNQRVNPSGELDEETLTKIANLTGGQYFRARNQQELEGIYQKINQLEPIKSEFLEFRPEKDLFYWPLSIAFILLFSALILLKIRGRDDLL